MALLAFDDPFTSPFSDLLSLSHRQQVVLSFFMPRQNFYYIQNVFWSFFLDLEYFLCFYSKICWLKQNVKYNIISRIKQCIFQYLLLTQNIYKKVSK